MRVYKSYYISDTFDRPDKVAYIVRWANLTMNGLVAGTPAFAVAKRIKSLCLKNYRLSKESDARFCPEWESHPERMMKWILEQYPDGKCKMVRRDKERGFEPSNIILKPLL